MRTTETIVKKILKCGAFCLEFINDPEEVERNKWLGNRVLYSGSAIGNGKFLWLVGERGLSEDGKETLYILRTHADSRECIEKELIWRFEHAIYVYEALAEKVLKDDARYNIWSVEHVTAIPNSDGTSSYIPSIPESWLIGDLVSIFNDKHSNFSDFKVIKTVFREDVGENDEKE